MNPNAQRRASLSSTIVILTALSLAGAACCAHTSVPAQDPTAAAPGPAAATATTPVAKARTAAPPRAEPTTVEACRACGGEWAQHGIATEPSCLCPTADADKRCRDGGECEGQCLADAVEREVTVPGPPARGYFLGKCSRYRTTFGCHRYIAAGALKAGPVALDEPPGEICAD